MSGSFRVYGTEADRPRYWKLELLTSDGARLALRDPRRLGRIRLLRDPPHEPPVSELGFDVLDEMPAAGELRALLSRRKAPIKAVLLDQGLFAGVGNWIADEALFQARISPHRAASSLDPSEVARLRRQLAAIVGLAVKVLARKQEFPRGWLFHRRWGRDSSAQTLRAERIVHETIGGRTAAWVPTRQR
jgi:formamidopyrimidine-DNA glycosylase